MKQSVHIAAYVYWISALILLVSSLAWAASHRLAVTKQLPKNVATPTSLLQAVETGIHQHESTSGTVRYSVDKSDTSARSVPGTDNRAAVDCARCHSCPDPTTDRLCLMPCTRPRQHDMKPTNAAPEIVVLGELADRFLPVPFDHAGHARMAQMTQGCVVCHHFTPEGEAHPSCKSCHEIAPEREDIRKPGLRGAYHRQCLSCHRDWSHETRCDACHLPRTGLDPSRPVVVTTDDMVGRMHPPIPEPDEVIYESESSAVPGDRIIFRHKDHIHRFGLNCVDCHREDNCLRCHEDRSGRPPRVRPVQDHHQPCISCHDVEDIDRCNQCHFEKGGTPPPRFDHVQTGWPLSRFHEEVGCRMCHKALPFARVESDCNACHANFTHGAFDHAVTGQRLDGIHADADCIDCHAERKFDRPPTCDSCHSADEGINFPAKRPGPTSASSPPGGPNR
jgi:hypothetical protein